MGLSPCPARQLARPSNEVLWFGHDYLLKHQPPDIGAPRAEIVATRSGKQFQSRLRHVWRLSFFSLNRLPQLTSPSISLQGISLGISARLTPIYSIFGAKHARKKSKFAGYFNG